MPTLAPPPAASIAAVERLHALDVLRGLALFGMIVVHFHQRVNTEASGVEGLIGWIVWVGLETKAWGTFAFLFGVGFAVLLRRMEERGAPFASFYLRRLAVLGAFGIVAEAFFGFSVLLSYAIWGVPLLLLRRLSTPALLAIAALAAAARPVISFASTFGLWPSGPAGAAPETTRLLQAMEAAARQGDYLELVAARARLLADSYLRLETLIPGVTLTLFILGMLALRHHLVDHPLEHRRTIHAWMIFGFLSWGLYWSIVYPIGSLPWPLASGFGLLNEQWLCFTFIGGVLLLTAGRPTWQHRIDWAGWAGRMALTNYMLQIALLDFLVSGYGLSLRLRPFLGMVGAALLFGMEVTLSRFWLARFRYGPCEWLWRSLTYGARQPLRRPATLISSREGA